MFCSFVFVCEVSNPIRCHVVLMQNCFVLFTFFTDRFSCFLFLFKLKGNFFISTSNSLCHYSVLTNMIHTVLSAQWALHTRRFSSCFVRFFCSYLFTRISSWSSIVSFYSIHWLYAYNWILCGFYSHFQRTPKLNSWTNSKFALAPSLSLSLSR